MDLGSKMTPISDDERIIIYRMDLSDPLPELALTRGTFVLVAGFAGILSHFPVWMKNEGFTEALKISLKILSRRRIFFGVVQEEKVVQSGWANLGFCRHYAVERDSVVLGTLWTAPEYRGQGLAPAAMRRVIAYLFQRGYRRFYVDTIIANKASQRMIAKTGFKPI
jgi:RimJ/RimL family protein N-acetyltransferase